MADVPTYGQRKQSLNPVFRGKLRDSSTPEAFGAGIGRGLQNLAAGVGKVADAVQVANALEDKAVVDQKLNEFSDYTRERTYNPDSGYMMLQGENAVTGRQTFEKDVEKRRSEIAGGLTPNQRKMYDRASQERRRQAYDTAVRHAGAQRKEWFDDATTARLETYSNDALAMMNEPEKLAQTMAAAEKEIAGKAEVSGWSPEQTANAQEEFRSGVNKNIVLKRAISDPLAAKAWLDEHRDQMTEAHQYELDKALDGPVLDAQATQEATRIATGGGADNRPPRANAAGAAEYRIQTANPNVNVDDLKPDVKTSFGKLQTALGRQLTVKSGHRSEAANKAAGGATQSQHLDGNAIDIDVRGMSEREKLQLINAAFDAGFTGIGVGTNSIHVDQGTPRAWGYATAAGGAPVPAYAAKLVETRLAGLKGEGGRPAAGSFTIGNAGPGFIEFVRPNGTVERREGTRAWRNNNPGNIRYGKFAKANGAVGSDGEFAVFPSYEAGRKAKRELLFNSTGYAGKTIAQAITRYAPPSENNTQAYIATVAESLGLPADTKLSDLTVSQQGKMMDAMEQVEGFSANGGSSSSIAGFVGPQYITDQVAGIEDPRLRAATASALSKMYAAQDAADRRAERQNKLAVEKFILQNPGLDPTKLPLDMQMQLGIDGMNTLWEYNDKLKQSGEPTTDEVLFAELTRLQAEDPKSFAHDVDMFDYLNRLSKDDRRHFQELQAKAIRDERSGKQEALTEAKSISSAMSIADNRLQAAGIRKTGKAANEESREREARFQRALVERMREFQKQEQRVPNDYEVSDMVDQLLVPIIMRTPGNLWDSTEEGFVFDAPFRPDGSTVEIDIPYEQIPADVRLAIREELAKELGRDPTEDEVKADYVEFVIKG